MKTLPGFTGYEGPRIGSHFTWRKTRMFDHLTREEFEQIDRVVDRAVALQATLMVPEDCMDLEERRTLRMDLCAVGGSCPMDWDRLIEADDSNFAHDVFGIRRHMDRTTGQLGGCFLPRFAKK